MEGMALESKGAGSSPVRRHVEGVNLGLNELSDLGRVVVEQEHRAIITRCDKTAPAYLTLFTLAVIRTWL